MLRRALVLLVWLLCALLAATAAADPLDAGPDGDCIVDPGACPVDIDLELARNLAREARAPRIEAEALVGLACNASAQSRSASMTAGSGNVPYSSAIPVCSACGHSCPAASHISPVSRAELELPS